MKQSIEAAINQIQKAFEPLQCVAKSDDYGARINFTVFDKDEPYSRSFSKAQYSDAARLNLLLDSARREVFK
ncbi:hypothetical protein [Roseateles violae]|uniref:Uncharacterized protein n=1 Tax=Roseateles violae TaxID=3058042 RepID=A0ABT8DP14_9BURK|nr:hypothetical protein [Pelomonas sp. PFR6]MDN3919746.1 hypothetical protein [Pelomonas sp. PFR6]